MAGLLRDTRFALRQLRRNLGFTIAATVLLAVASQSPIEIGSQKSAIAIPE